MPQVRSGDRCVMALVISEVHQMPILQAAMIVDYVVDYVVDPPTVDEALQLEALGEFAEAVRNQKDEGQCQHCASAVWTAS